jgi:hypothetical protein
VRVRIEEPYVARHAGIALRWKELFDMLNPFTALLDWYLTRKHKALFRELYGIPRRGCVLDNPPGVGLRTVGPLPQGYHQRVGAAMNAASGYAAKAWCIAREFDCHRYASEVEFWVKG